ncbi:MAG TPA: hypothetical protein VGL77_12620 [Armatimonadota bacterium]|jgi:hypothetical protein
MNLAGGKEDDHHGINSRVWREGWGPFTVVGKEGDVTTTSHRDASIAIHNRIFIAN